MNTFEQEQYEEQVAMNAQKMVTETKNIIAAVKEVECIAKLNQANTSIIVAKRLDEHGSHNMLIAGKTQLGKTDLAGVGLYY